MRATAAGVVAALLLLAGGAHAAVEVEARLSRSRIAVGEATSLEVVVRGASGGVGEPEFAVPAGLELLGTGRSQNFTWINGRSSSEIVHRFELAAAATGRFAIGPILVRAGREVFRSGALTLEVAAAAARVGGAGSGAASLEVDVTPAEPWQGQPCVLRVRLVQRTALAEEPQYLPPPTPGFWTDKPTPPESYYADERGQRVLVTETRTRLFPLAAGTLTVGEAEARLALPTGGGDPLAWLGGQVPRREEVVRSRPVAVRVRPLPPDPPRGFTGAVGRLAVRWSADRPRTTVDVPVTLRLDVSGAGNLPLVRPPELRGDDLEVFASTLDDSLPGGAGEGGGRRRFQWTVLARRPGRLAIPAPAFAWFDPASGGYRRAEAPPVRLEVGPAMFADDRGGAGLPPVFARHPADPGGRPARPWGWALGGLLLGAAVALARASAAAPGADAERARALEWLRAVGRTGGPDFWRAAEESLGWLEARGRAVGPLRRQVAAARYAGGGGDPAALRPRLVEAISASLPPARATGPRRAAAVALAVLAIAACGLTAPRPGGPRARAAAQAADRAAQDGDLARARAGWERLWRAGGRDPGLAARLAWAESQAGATGPAAGWVARGQQVAARDPALDWVAERVREAGGLVGEVRVRLPVRPIEWGVAALLLGALGGWAWPARRRVAAAAVLVVLCGLAEPAQDALSARSARGVILSPVTIEGEGLELQPGQVVRVRERRGGRARVAAGAGVEGWVPAAAVDIVPSGG